MTKILHIIGLAHGGAGQHLLSLASGCDSRRFESAVALADSSPMLPQFVRAGIRVLPLPLDHYGGLKRNLVAFRQLAGILRRETFDIIQTHTSVAGAIGRVAAKLFSRAPVVHMLHAYGVDRFPAGGKRKAARFVERQLDRWTDWYIAGSRAMIERGLAERIFSRDKVALISNGIDLTQFDYNVKSASFDESHCYHNGHAGITVGYLGRLEKIKGVAHLIRAAAIVCRQNPSVRFLIAGDGSLRPQLEQLAHQLQVAEAIEFTGWRRDVVGFIKQIDILAMPSQWEAFGLSATEAMALEKPVIASRIGGLPEVVKDGRTGLLVEPENPVDLARAILELAADPARREKLGQQGRVRVEKLFTLERMISRHEVFYERLLGVGHDRQVVAEEFAAAAKEQELSLTE